MGACFSRSETEDPSPTAKVISVNGQLQEYAVPVTVSQVLHLEAAPSSSLGFFICNSDGLYYEERILPLPPGEELVGNQIYFVLPESKLNVRLKATEMAALAVKASLALRNTEEKGISGSHRRRGRASMKISPVIEVHDEGGYDGNTTSGMDSGCFRDEMVSYGRGRNGKDIVGNRRNVARSGSLRRVTRVASSKRAKIAVRSFGMRLTTIYEGTVM